MTTCIMQRSVDAHFAAAIAPADEQKLRAHLPTCDACRARYRRRLVLASLDPEAPSAEARLAQGLGLAATAEARPAARAGRVALAASFVLAVAAAVLLFVFASRPTDDGFAARGSPTALPPSRVVVYRASPGAEPAPLAGAVRRDAELAFAYENGAGKERLMIFGVDEHGHVFWYYPAWTDAAADPAAIVAAKGEGRHELREGISHDLDGARLEIHALFVDRALTVRDVERVLAGKRAPVGPLAIAGAIDHVVPLDVTP